MFVFSVGSDQVVVGRDPEEGTEIFAENFSIVATRADGFRLRHEFCPTNMVQVYNEEEGWFSWVWRPEGEVEAVMDRLLHRIEDHVANGGKLDLVHWEPTFPVYGSEEYQDQEALGVHRAWEKAVDTGERSDHLYAIAGMPHLHALAA